VPGQKVHDDFSVHGGLEDCPACLKVGPQLIGIDQITVMADPIVFITEKDSEGLSVGEQ